MPKALTIEEKVLKRTEQINQQASPEVAPTERKLVIRKAPDRPAVKTRGVFNGTRGKLKIDDAIVKAFQEAGWTLHIFNDSPGRIEEALLDGWEFVDRDEAGITVDNVVNSNVNLGTKVQLRVGQNDNGDGLFGYLMKIPTNSYKESQANLQKRNDMIDDAIRGGKISNRDNFYGEEGIKLGRK